MRYLINVTDRELWRKLRLPETTDSGLTVFFWTIIAGLISCVVILFPTRHQAPADVVLDTWQQVYFMSTFALLATWAFLPLSQTVANKVTVFITQGDFRLFRQGVWAPVQSVLSLWVYVPGMTFLVLGRFMGGAVLFVVFACVLAFGLLWLARFVYSLNKKLEKFK